MENINQHLSSQGLLWREEKVVDTEDTVDDDASLCIIPATKPSYQKSMSFTIQGMFDPNIAIERTVRHAAKFVTAEEEAESRKQELDALKKRHETATATSTATVSETTAENALYVAGTRESEFDNESSSEITLTVSVGGADTPSEGVDSEGAGPRSEVITPPLSIMTESVCTGSGRTTNQHTAHPTPCAPGLISSPRHVLSAVDPDLILRLNKIFTPQKQRFTPGSSCTVSIASSPIRLRGRLFDMALEEESDNVAGVAEKENRIYCDMKSVEGSESGSCQTNTLTASTPDEIMELILIPCSAAVNTTISSAPAPAPTSTINSKHVPAPLHLPHPAPLPVLVPVVFKGSQSKFLQV